MVGCGWHLEPGEPPCPGWFTHNGQTLQLMSVQLKSGRVENTSTSPDCALLLAQVPVLEGWIDAAAEGPTPFIVLGDFNRRFTQPHDRVWPDLDDGGPPTRTSPP